MSKNANDDKKYPCMRDKYKWGDHRPAVPDQRVIAKENTVLHGLEEGIRKYYSALAYEIAIKTWNNAGDRRAELVRTHPHLVDIGCFDAANYCYDRVQTLKKMFESLGKDALTEIKDTLELSGNIDDNE